MKIAPAEKSKRVHTGFSLTFALAAFSSSVFAAPFTHPGLINNQAQLEFIRDKIKAGAQPWTDAFNRVNSSNFASLSYTPHPFADVECGPYSNPDIGCSEEMDDAIAAYTHALLWVFTGKTAHAQKGIQILDAWSSTLKTHSNSNANLQAGWVAAMAPRAAEILRHTGSGWSAAGIKQYSAMLNSAYLPYIKKGSVFAGNWELTMIEGILNIGIFEDDTTLFQQAISMWRKRVPAYFYLTSDGPYPVKPPNETKTDAQMPSYWYNQSTFVDGLSQETCRDFNHTGMGLASTLNTAETALLQGVNLYAEQKQRLTAAMEFHAGYLNGQAVPSWLCGGKLNLSKAPTWEIGYNEYHNRLGMALPNTLTLIKSIRPTKTQLHMAWETLTHAELDTAGMTAVRTGKLFSHKPSASILFFNGGNFRVIWPDAHDRLRARGLNGAALPGSAVSYLNP